MSLGSIVAAVFLLGLLLLSNVFVGAEHCLTVILGAGHVLHEPARGRTADFTPLSVHPGL